jgi:hypothetical protein
MPLPRLPDVMIEMHQIRAARSSVHCWTSTVASGVPFVDCHGNAADGMR